MEVHILENQMVLFPHINVLQLRVHVYIEAFEFSLIEKRKEKNYTIQ